MSAWFPPPEEAKALEEAVALLRQVEWHGFYGDSQCPYCHRYKLDLPRAHATDCALDAFLKRWGNGRP